MMSSPHRMWCECLQFKCHCVTRRPPLGMTVELVLCGNFSQHFTHFPDFILLLFVHVVVVLSLHLWSRACLSVCRNLDSATDTARQHLPHRESRQHCTSRRICYSISKVMEKNFRPFKVFDDIISTKLQCIKTLPTSVMARRESRPRPTEQTVSFSAEAEGGRQSARGRESKTERARSGLRESVRTDGGERATAPAASVCSAGVRSARVCAFAPPAAATVKWTDSVGRAYIGHGPARPHAMQSVLPTDGRHPPTSVQGSALILLQGFVTYAWEEQISYHAS